MSKIIANTSTSVRTTVSQGGQSSWSIPTGPRFTSAAWTVMWRPSSSTPSSRRRTSASLSSGQNLAKRILLQSPRGSSAPNTCTAASSPMTGPTPKRTSSPTTTSVERQSATSTARTTTSAGPISRSRISRKTLFSCWLRPCSRTFTCTSFRPSALQSRVLTSRTGSSASSASSSPPPPNGSVPAGKRCSTYTHDDKSTSFYSVKS